MAEPNIANDVSLAVMCPCGHAACYHHAGAPGCAGSGDLTAPAINQPNVWACRCRATREDVTERHCATPDCPGDGRYWPPGKGHSEACSEARSNLLRRAVERGSCQHDWSMRGDANDPWRECFLCGAVENLSPIPGGGGDA